MQVQDQTEVTAWLADPFTHGGAAVEVIDTHVSRVFLVGNRALKMKRAVRLPYADFSTPAIRLAACEKEHALNVATAPELYLGPRRITRQGEGLAFDGDGELVDAVVEMRRFDAACRLDLVARRGELTAPLVTTLADRIAAAQEAAEIRTGVGGAEIVAGVLAVNRAGFAESAVFDAAEVAALDAAFRAALGSHAALLDARAAQGRVRRCHGDLHLRNACLIEGRPVLFDCLDFNDELATVDVAYDMAFMAMDLWQLGLTALSSRLVNRYLDVTGQEDALALLPFFVALRAAVRAHVTATHSVTAVPAEAAGLREAARDYLDLAREALAPGPARLVALGGPSGSGKSTLAEALAPWLGAPPGARIVESDRIRKAMRGVAPDTRLPEDAYAPEVSEAVYRAMADRAGTLLRAGCSVVADAVFDRPERRAALVAAGRAAGVPVTAIWLDAPPAELRQRIATRVPGASDATVEVLDRQLARDPGPLDWTRLPTGRPLDETLAAIRSVVGTARHR